jgi:hypothetical protein
MDDGKIGRGSLHVKLFYTLVYFEGKKYFVDRHIGVLPLYVEGEESFFFDNRVCIFPSQMQRILLPCSSVITWWPSNGIAVLTKLFLRLLELYIACNRYVDY